MLVDRRLSWNVEIPKITPELIREAKNREPLSVNTRLSRLIRFLKLKSEDIIGKPIILHRNEMDSNIAEVFAWSESVGYDEVDMLIDYLIKESLVEEKAIESHLNKRIIRITIKGWNDTGNPDSSIDSSQCFVAMWLDESMNDLYENGIEPAIKKAGYEALLISRKNDIEHKIDDEIVKEIRRSKFVVSDFSHGEEGARGSVYFEAGFAIGIGIPVIFTCRDDIINKLHFDTRQYPHLVWYKDKLEQFRNGLYDRIVARIGMGPN